MVGIHSKMIFIILVKMDTTFTNLPATFRSCFLGFYGFLFRFV